MAIGAFVYIGRPDAWLQGFVMRSIYLLRAFSSLHDASPKGWMRLYAALTLEIALALLALAICLTKSF